MQLPGLSIEFTALAAPLPVWHARVDAAQWLAAAQVMRDSGARLLALWAGAADAPAQPTACVAYASAQGACWLTLPLAEGATYPDLVPYFPVVARMQRAAADLSGIRAEGAQDQRAWLNHGAWPDDYRPLRAPGTRHPTPTPLQNYDFVRVEGDGVHEIPVGPVHAGIIEPGHFRFSIVGEKVLRLEQRLGYTHKGIEQRISLLPPVPAAKLAGRVSGDSSVAYAWAYCMALESAAQTSVPERALWLRALLLERERIANHLGDLGALGNDAAFAFGLAQFSRLREDWLRVSHELFGHRWLMDRIVPGGVAVDLDGAGADRLRRQCNAIEDEVRTLLRIYESHAGLQDRFLTTGRVPPQLAAQLGLTGLAGRASAQARDLRCDHAWLPYALIGVTQARHAGGDVAARVAVRFDEVFESLRLIRRLLDAMPAGPIACEVVLPQQAAIGVGWVEGWRGEIWVALELADAKSGQRIRRCHLHDPSWQNWPVLEHAIMGNIVPDFPLINKSFNLSYSGQDL